MSAFADIKLSSIIDVSSLKTSSATIGVDTTFNPVGYVAPGVAKWEDRSGGISVGFPTVTLSVRPPSKTSRVYKVTCKLTVPTLEQTSASTSSGIQPAPTKAYDCQAIIEMLMPERSTLAERQKLFFLGMSLWANTVSASDGSPTDATLSPFVQAAINYDRPY